MTDFKRRLRGMLLNVSFSQAYIHDRHICFTILLLHLAFAYFSSYCIIDSEKPRGDEPIKYVCICMCVCR